MVVVRLTISEALIIIDAAENVGDRVEFTQVILSVDDCHVLGADQSPFLAERK